LNCKNERGKKIIKKNKIKNGKMKFKIKKNKTVLNLELYTKNRTFHGSTGKFAGYEDAAGVDVGAGWHVQPEKTVKVWTIPACPAFPHPRDHSFPSTLSIWTMHTIVHRGSLEKKYPPTYKTKFSAYQLRIFDL
jgi:hypothetical protein